MDNIDKYEDLIKDVVANISLATNVKFIITTRSPNLIEGIHSIHVGLFSQSEADEFVANKLIKKKLTPSQKENLNSLISFEGEILPLKLKTEEKYKILFFQNNIMKSLM
jgi:hypothetical protein